MSTARRITRKERRQQRQQIREEKNLNIVDKLHFDLKDIEPLTHNQAKTFNLWEEGQNLLLVGTAGTGKSFLSAYLGMKSLKDSLHSFDPGP